LEQQLTKIKKMSLTVALEVLVLGPSLAEECGVSILRGVVFSAYSGAVLSAYLGVGLSFLNEKEGKRIIIT